MCSLQLLPAQVTLFLVQAATSPGVLFSALLVQIT
jgi:hypothetical protein